MPHIVVRTGRLIARHLQPNDVAEMLVVHGDVEAMKWVGDGGALTETDALRWFEVTETNYRLRGYGMRAVQERLTGEVIGFCGLVHPGGQPEVEIKYAFKRHSGGQGLATETVRAMLDYGMREIGLGHVIASTAPEDLASHHVLLKAGMVRGALRSDVDCGMTPCLEWQARGPHLDRRGITLPA